jgi:hypothetical protein
MKNDVFKILNYIIIKNHAHCAGYKLVCINTMMLVLLIFFFSFDK